MSDEAQPAEITSPANEPERASESGREEPPQAPQVDHQLIGEFQKGHTEPLDQPLEPGEIRKA